MLWIGHRGAAALAPENSVEGCRLAVELGVDSVELDVLPGLVLGHDRAGDTHLETVLDLFALELTETGLLLDLKLPGYERPVLDALRERGLERRTIVCSTDPHSLARLDGVRRSLSYPEDRFRLSERRGAAPAVRSGLAALRRLLPFRIRALCAATGADAVTLHHAVVSAELVRRCPVPVFAWTVDERALAERLERLGVAGIITNDPRILLCK